MLILIKNFFYGLKCSISQFVGLVVALVMMISLFTKFWLSWQYGYNQVRAIEGDYLGSMVADYHQANLNDQLWNNVSYNSDNAAGISDYFNKLSTITIAHRYNANDQVIANQYEAKFYDGENAWLGEPSAILHNSTKYFFNFVNPFSDYRDDHNYVNFDLLANYCEQKGAGDQLLHPSLHLLPSLENFDNKFSMIQLFATYDNKHLGANMTQKALAHWSQTLFAANSNEYLQTDKRDVFFEQANLFSKKLLWEIIIGINGKEFRVDDHFSYSDPIKQLNWIAFPHYYIEDKLYYSNPVFSEGTKQRQLIDDEVLLTKNFAEMNNFGYDKK